MRNVLLTVECSWEDVGIYVYSVQQRERRARGEGKPYEVRGACVEGSAEYYG